MVKPLPSKFIKSFVFTLLTFMAQKIVFFEYTYLKHKSITLYRVKIIKICRVI